MVRGRGGAGKSTTIDAMAGREFDANHPSTVGAAMEDVELQRIDLGLSGAAAAAISDKEMGLGHCAVRRVARQLSRGGSPAVYMYLFAHPPIRDDTDGTYGWIFGPQFFEPGNMVSVALHPRHAKTGCGVGCRVCGMGERVRARHAQPSPLTR